MPREIDISIPGLDLPIASNVVWKRDGQAGVQLNWPLEPAAPPSPEALAARLQQVQEKPVAAPAPAPVSAKPAKRKRRISAFGL